MSAGKASHTTKQNLKRNALARAHTKMKHVIGSGPQEMWHALTIALTAFVLAARYAWHKQYKTAIQDKQYKTSNTSYLAHFLGIVAATMRYK